MLILPAAKMICIALNKCLYGVCLLFSLWSLRMKSAPQCCQGISTPAWGEKTAPKGKAATAERSSDEEDVRQSAPTWSSHGNAGVWEKIKSCFEYFHWLGARPRRERRHVFNKALNLWSFCNNIDENISPLWWFMFIGYKRMKYGAK